MPAPDGRPRRRGPRSRRSTTSGSPRPTSACCGFSPTTRYKDYAISRTLIHWESQSSTRADSPTGLRYRNQERDGRSILLFTRLRADDRAFWFLGPATYRGHVGEKPMAITWELACPLSGDLYSAFAAAVA